MRGRDAAPLTFSHSISIPKQHYPHYMLLLLTIFTGIIMCLCVVYLKESEAMETGNIAPPTAAVAGHTFSTLGESY